MDIKPLIKEDFLTFQKDETLSSLIGRLKTAEKRDALIFDHDKLLGVIEPKWLIKSNLNPQSAKIAKLVKKSPLVEENLDLIEAAYLMYQSNLHFLPVVRGKQLVGVVYGLDLIKEAARLEPLREIDVAHLKITKNIKLSSQDTLASALDIMFKERLEQIPLVDPQGKLAGLISFRDILKKFFLSPASRAHGHRNLTLSGRAFTPDRPELDQFPLGPLSTTFNLITITPQDKLTKAIELMHQHNLIDLILVRDNEPFGLLTLKNILRKIASLQTPQNFNIKFVGLEKTALQPYQKYNLKKIASQEAFKLQRELNNEFSLTIHIKEYAKAGGKEKRRKYSVNLRLEYPGSRLTSERGQRDRWDIETALRQSFNNLKNNLKIKFRGDSSHRKGYE